MKSNLSIRQILQYIGTFIAIGLMYYLAARFSYLNLTGSMQASSFYIPAGLGIGAIIIFGARYLPAIFFAKFALGLSAEWSLSQAFVSCSASVIETYVAFYLYQSFNNAVEEYFEYYSKLIIVAGIALLAPIFSALIGVTHLYYLGIITEQSYFYHLYTWYTGNILSILIFVPGFLSFRDEKHRFFDLIVPFVALLLTYVFKYQVTAPYLHAIFIVILIPSLFGSVSGIHYSVIMISLLLNWFLVKYEGPFALGTYSENQTSMQLFLLAISITAMTLEGIKKSRLLKSALVPLLSFWLLTGVIYYYYHTQKDLANEQIVKDVISDFDDHLEEKMNFYKNGLEGAAAFVANSSTVEKDEWDAFLTAIDIPDFKNGVQGMGVIYLKSAYPTYVNTIYPDNLNNQNKLENLVDHPELKDYFNKAIYRDRPILTPAIIFELPDASERLISFLVMAVKRKGRFIGWVVAPIDMRVFFQSISEDRFPLIDIDVYDGNAPSRFQQIYTKVVDSKIRKNDRSAAYFTTLNLGEHPYTIDWNETLRFVSTHNSQNSFIILVGSVLSLIVTGFILNLKLVGEKANRIANMKTMELRESEERFKSLFENSNDAVVLFNDNEIIDCNPESLVLFGKRSKKELMSTPLLQLFQIRDLDSTEDKTLFQNKVREVKSKKTVKFECFCMRGNFPFFAEMHLNYIEVNDKFIYQAVVRDISERKKIEQNLTKSKELAEDAARAKSNFLSTMSHEIRTPLNGVVGMINIILEENPESDFREDLETIKYSADNLLNIVNEVLDYSKIESGKITLETKDINLRNLCENILKTHRSKAQKKNIGLKLEFDSKVPEIVYGDELRNTQILNNLLGNALKFTEVGEVSLNVRLKQKKEDICIIEFRVSDTGIGIDKSKQREIFKDFTQAESDHARKYGGTGLGLAITKRLVEIQNGKIDVISNPNLGTSFIYTIPFAIKTEVPMNVTSNLSQKVTESFRGQRVLLVEDNQVNIIVTKKFLEKWGLKVDVAINGLEAVNHVRALQYDLILMDLHMPLMDGFEATKKIREFNKETPIIGLSADVMTESVGSLQAIGMNDFVTKPFRPNDFFIKLKSYFA